MYISKIGSVTFKLKEKQDFSWLQAYGNIFSVIDETGSGCICFGIESDKKYFYKIAGAKTVGAEMSQEESITLLKKAVQIYEDIKHPSIIQLVKSFTYQEFFVAVFAWAEGECLFDHWNFDLYKQNPEILSPAKRFQQLPIAKKQKVASILFSFFDTVHKHDYIAVDFYDGSIMYGFNTDRITICDIDLFVKRPVINTLGKDYPGTKRLKAPEENIVGEIILEDTNVFTLGAILFDMFTSPSKEDMQERYLQGYFIPAQSQIGVLHTSIEQVLLKATKLERTKRYQTIKEFHKAWIQAWFE
jgi:serine/threonine-protein kinase